MLSGNCQAVQYLDAPDRPHINNSKTKMFVFYSLTHLSILTVGILPQHPESHQFVMQQRRQQYDDLRHTLKVTESIDEGTSMSMAFLKMYLLQEGKLPMDDTNLVSQCVH